MFTSNGILFKKGASALEDGQYKVATDIFSQVIDKCLHDGRFCELYVWCLYYRADATYELLEYGTPVQTTFDLAHRALNDYAQFRLLARSFNEIFSSFEYQRSEFAMAVIKSVYLNLPAEAYPVFEAWCVRYPSDKVAFENKILSATKIPGFEKESLRLLDEYERQYPQDTAFVDLRQTMTSKVMFKYRKSKHLTFD